MNANRFILHVVLFGVACIGAWLGWRAWPMEKPTPYTNGITNGSARLLVDTNLCYVSNGLIVVTNMRPQYNLTMAEAISPNTVTSALHVGFILGWYAHKSGATANDFVMLCEAMRSNRTDIGIQWLYDHK